MSTTSTSTRSVPLLIGTYTESLPHVNGIAPGILGTTEAGGALAAWEVLAEVRNPSWLAVTADDRFVYTVIETVMFEGGPGGGAAALERDVQTGALTLINAVPSAGVEPAAIGLDPSERFVIVANYRTGSLSVFERRTDGGLGAMVEHVQHEGSSVHPIRQTGPHAHQVIFDPASGLLLVPDLGLDALLFYTLSAEGGLTERLELRIPVAPGAGPRHVAFHPDGQHLFLINELDNTVLVLRRNSDGDGFTVVSTASTLPPDYTGHNQTAAIRVSASGAYVFASNRGDDSIAMLAFDAQTEELSLSHTEPSRGKEPRDLVQTPDGGAILVANQDGDSVVTLAIDERAGTLSFVASAEVPTPVCLVFLHG